MVNYFLGLHFYSIGIVSIEMFLCNPLFNLHKTKETILYTL